MSLPANVIDRLFRRLAATYGAAWDRSLGSAPLDDVKAIWADELAGFAGNLAALAYALEHLSERCPNVIEFKAACRRAPPPDVARLSEPAPAAMPPHIRAELAKLRAAPADKPDAQELARRILARRAAGEQVSYSSLSFARNCVAKTVGRTQEEEAA